MKLVLTPSKILTEKAKPVAKIDNKIRKIVKEMKEILYKSEIGVGLAGPQVGLPLRLFIAAPDLVNPQKRKKAKYYTFINPVIKQTVNSKQSIANNKIPASTSTVQHSTSENPASPAGRQPQTTDRPTLEGCLSIPNIWGKVERRQIVTLSYCDENGKKWTKNFNGLMAIIIQHEMDHLKGTLFTQHVLSQGEKLYQQVKKDSGKYLMEEVEI